MSRSTPILPPLKSPLQARTKLDSFVSNLNTFQRELHNYKEETFLSLPGINTFRSLPPLAEERFDKNFNLSLTYKLGKKRIEQEKRKEERAKKIEKEKNLLMIIHDDNPTNKKYMTYDMFSDKENYKILKSKRRKFGVNKKKLKKSRMNNQYFQTPQANYKFKRGREKTITTQTVAKCLNTIFFNYAYRNSPRNLTNAISKEIDGSLSRSPSYEGSLPITECISPDMENTDELMTLKSMNQNELADCIKRAIQKTMMEASDLKSKLNRLKITKASGTVVNS
ncbi:unnamed protein product [Blepharisma stoltei]|uniref:Uncharacterized protein n=1 Tax=Blepharisma stoltei TaxID=1481888 RepID=A0AAU9JLJ5_9CILI|nr:unnamed protein product [Blepharisma stoltei]